MLPLLNTIAAGATALSFLGIGQQAQKPASTEAAAEKLGGPDSTQQEFLDFARMSVGERIRAQYLKESGLSEESLGQMDSKMRAKIEEEIRDKIRAAIKQDGGKDSGSIANLLV